jgi:hypothetical protein
MGKCRTPGPQGCGTLRMRSPSSGGPNGPLKVGSVTFLEGSAHPLAFRILRPHLVPDSPSGTPPRKVTVGTNDVDVTVGKDKPPDPRPVALPDEWAVAAGLAEEHVPLSFQALQHLPNGAKTYKIKRPMLSLDLSTGIIKGTAVLSIPDSSGPEHLVAPLEIPVQITIKVPQSADVKALRAHVRACKVACVDATVEVRYDRERLVKLVREMTKAAKDMKQTGAKVNLGQVVLDVEELVKDAISQLGQSIVQLQASAHGPATWIDATVDPSQNTTDYRWLGFNLIPKGPLFDFAVPGWGYRGNRILGHRIPHTFALLAYPSLPAIFAGEHWTSKFPAYVYGEVSHARKVTSGLELGVRLTVALDIWERLGLEPGLTPPNLFEPLPAGSGARNVPARYLSERGTALSDIKSNLGPANNMQPWIMLKVEGRFDWF